ncbi:hypothetical protein DSO57_1022268 [Entomophthora muscae]|uniref:Uncharacterized protein n=1 Tax=Entomophthora muscae TaxID=34485 RepID=A0ACC2RI04_9FUNG|nr:hypothetical protein DSO57_1022268 [Entomophthora muscae]
MNYLIFTAVLTACLGIGGYQQGSEFFGPSPEGLGHNSHYDPGQLNSSHTGPWPPLVSPHSTLSIAMYTSMYYILTYFTRSFGRYNVHAKIFRWLMTIYPILTALTGFQFANLLPYMLQVVPTVLGYYRPHYNKNPSQTLYFCNASVKVNKSYEEIRYCPRITHSSSKGIWISKSPMTAMIYMNTMWFTA